MNPYETSEQKLIPAVLVYVAYGDEILMLHRVKEAHEDYHSGKWNGLGGKLEKHESFEQAAVRELKEESGIDVEPSKLSLRGTLHFPNFKAHKNEDWFAYVYWVDLSGQEKKPTVVSPVEGKLHWINRDEVLSLNVWAADHRFLPLLLKGQKFHATFWYEGHEVVREKIDVVI